MKLQDISHLRLLNQHISKPTFKKPVEVVDWLVAVQAQDFYGAKWSLGLRMQNATDGELDQAFNNGLILRTHLLRPTWHFVAPTDIRWLLDVTAPQVHKINAYMYRQLELDEAILNRGDALLEKALRGGKNLTREELRDVLTGAGIDVKQNLRMSYFVMHAELEGIICSGPRRGKQFTYVLLDERVPQSKSMGREESSAELARRYFTSRGPATVQDFAKWSGLTVADSRSGLEAIQRHLEHESIDGQSYWFSESTHSNKIKSPTAYLLSVYDEYVTSYKDRSAMAGGELTKLFNAMGNALQYIIVLNGEFVGTWKRTLKKDAVHIQLNPLKKLTDEESQAVTEAAERYGAFHHLPVILEM